jgi:hypothetical protein
MTTETASTFEDFLQRFEQEGSIIGDLARDAARDPDWPTGGDIDQLRYYLFPAGPQAMAALEAVWAAFQQSTPGQH